jgi:Zn-dependent protease
MILNLINNPFVFLAYFVSFFISLTLHEASHAWAAYKLGDNTAKEMGRLSLNPLKHIDPWGAIFFFIAGFGWGNPVQFNPERLKNPKVDSVLVALAGPAANLILAIFFSLIYRLFPLGDTASQFIILLISINIIWMIFNLLPIPPLDGSHILAVFLPPKAYYVLQQIGLPLLLILLFFSPYIHTVISFILSFFMKILIGTVVNI